MAGQQYDQGSELYCMRARYYDPELGRFLSEDPIGISGGLNLYAYAGNDPVNVADPSGMAATTHIIVWGTGTDWCSTQWGCAPSGTTCAAGTDDGMTLQGMAAGSSDLIPMAPGNW